MVLARCKKAERFCSRTALVGVERQHAQHHRPKFLKNWNFLRGKRGSGELRGEIGPRKGIVDGVREDPKAAADPDETRQVVPITPDSLAEYYKGTSVIDPRKSKFMPVWDVILLLALFYTATVTPFEVTFIDEGACITPLFVVNRVVDFIFICDTPTRCRSS